MSGFLAGASAVYQGLPVSDQRLNAQNYADPLVGEYPDQPFLDGNLWPSSTGLGGQLGYAGVGGDAGSDNRWGVMPRESGGCERLKLRGTSRDSSGNALGSCTVSAFLTSTNAFVGSAVSDSGGYFEIPTPFVGAAHYIVAYRAGSPDVTGTTLNTLVPS